MRTRLVEVWDAPLGYQAADVAVLGAVEGLCGFQASLARRFPREEAYD